MDIANVRAQLALAAAVLPGLNTFAYVPDSIPSPAFVVAEVEVDFDAHSMRGRGDEVRVTCRILVSKADDKSSQATLDAYLGRGSGSLKVALEAARGAPGEAALNGACDDFHVTNVRNYRYYAHGEIDYVGAEITVRCIGEGDG